MWKRFAMSLVVEAVMKVFFPDFNLIWSLTILVVANVVF